MYVFRLIERTRVYTATRPTARPLPLHASHAQWNNMELPRWNRLDRGPANIGKYYYKNGILSNEIIGEPTV